MTLPFDLAAHAVALLLGLMSGVSAQQSPMETRVVIPGVTSERPSVVAHEVEEGQTLSTLATLYATTEQTLQALNPSTPAAPGNVVVVPKPGPAPATLPCGDLLAPVDKQHALPADCAPAELAVLPAEDSYSGEQRMEPRARAALLEMLDAVEAATGQDVVARSSYRSYQTQVVTFQYWVDTLGYDRAIQVSAMPGHSEHQLGTTADLTNAAVGFELEEAFGDTAAGAWIAANGWQYGFVISYPEGAQDITGYDYEPWHVRWVGNEAAAAINESGLTPGQWLLREWKPGRYLLPNP